MLQQSPFDGLEARGLLPKVTGTPWCMCGIVEMPLQLDYKVPNSKGLGSAPGRSQWEKEFRLRQGTATLQRAVRWLLEHMLPGQ